MATIIIPARVGSTRLPGKMLLSETGVPLIVHTYNNALLATDNVYVSTPDDEVIDKCIEYSIPCVKTSRSSCGTHNVLLAAEKLNIKGDVINLQGDYPSINKELLVNISKTLVNTVDNNTIISSYYNTLVYNHALSVNRVKIAMTDSGSARYFSRSVVPSKGALWHIHIGVYGFKGAAVNKLLDMYQSSYWSQLDYREGLEQSPWLDNGFRINFVKDSFTLGIDSREDYNEFKHSINR